MPPSPFSAITGDNGKALKRFSRHPVGDDIRIAKVIVAHEEKPREQGQDGPLLLSERPHPARE